MKTIKNEWIDVSIKPQDTGLYLVWHKKGIGADVEIMNFNHEGNWRSFNDFKNQNDLISHWRPMPNKPTHDLSFEEVVMPCIKWLCENRDPHSTIIISSTNAELLSGEKNTGQVLDFVND